MVTISNVSPIKHQKGDLRRDLHQVSHEEDMVTLLRSPPKFAFSLELCLETVFWPAIGYYGVLRPVRWQRHQSCVYGLRAPSGKSSLCVLRVRGGKSRFRARSRPECRERLHMFCMRALSGEVSNWGCFVDKVLKLANGRPPAPLSI